MPITHYVWVFFCVCLISACGSGNTTTEPPRQILDVANAYPQDGAIDIPVFIPQIQIKLNEELDPSTVKSSNIHLMPGDGNLIHGDVTDDEDEVGIRSDVVSGQIHFDAANSTIHFTPSAPLNHGTKYHIRIQGLKLKDGRTVATGPDTVQYTFTTAHLMEESRTYFRVDNSGNLTPGVRQEYIYLPDNNLDRINIYDHQGVLSRIIQRNITLPGGDKVSSVNYSAEKEILSYKKDLYDEAGLLIAHGSFKDPGTDLIWGNNNDLLSSYSENNHEHNSHRVYISYSIKRDLRQQGIFYSAWDDRQDKFEMTSVMLTEHQGNVFDHRFIVYRSRGENETIDFDEAGNPAPIDDIVSYWVKRDFDPNTGLRTHNWNMEGNYDRATSAIDPVKHRNLFTAENEVQSLTYYTYEDAGPQLQQKRLKTIFYYTSAGDDKSWEALDDNKIRFRIEFEYDEKDLLVKRSRYKYTSNDNNHLFEVRNYRTY